MGLVTSLARPGGNLTGINFLAGELVAKRLELLRGLVPGARRIAVLVNPADQTITETTLRDAETAARAMGLQIQVHNASSSREIEASFASFVRERPDGLFVPSSAFFNDRRVQLALLAVLRRLPATYPFRDYAEAGGLMSYGASLRDTFRQLGAQTGRILKGAKPADLPVVQSTKYEFVINLQAARAIEVEVPNAVQLLADELIE
jgi:putative tryptophan/tyrosine transport system substrate-binding protein